MTLLCHREGIGHLRAGAFFFTMQVGGSGHLGYVSYKLGKIDPPKSLTVQGKVGCEITYLYTVVVMTAFTYEPDNPPYQYEYQKIIIVDNQGRLLQEGSKDLKWSNLDMDVDVDKLDLEDEDKKCNY